MTYNNTGFESEEGRSFPYVYLSPPGQNGESNATGRLRVWIQAAVHGNEPASDQAILALLGEMDSNQTWAESLLDSMDIMVLPRYNPDGVAYFQRTLATNYDPNRDHIKLARQQTRDIKHFINSFAPHVVVDMHEYGASTRYGGSFVHAADALFSAAKNLNIDQSIRNMSEDLFAANMGEDLAAQGFRWEPYVTGSSNSTPGSQILFAEAGSDAKIGRNAMGLTQSITFLCETRGIGLADQQFQRRTAAGLAMVQSILQTAADNAEEVYQTVEDGAANFIDGQEEIVVTDYSEVSNRTYLMINVENGTVVEQPIQFSSTTPTTANLTRTRPEFYLIPRAWADIAARMEVYGLEVETLEDPYSGAVETFNITSTTVGSVYYEGVFRVTVATEPITRDVTLPPGSFRVSTRQKNAALAFIALEPENIDSLAAFNVIPLEPGDEYPIFRIV